MEQEINTLSGKNEAVRSNTQPTHTAPLSTGVAVLVWLGLIALAVVSRTVVYFRVEDVLHADEAVQGLMARHILGGSVQLFTYGLPFLGTLQAHLIALGFALFGSSVAVMKWVAGIESLVLVVAGYLLASEVAGRDRRAGFIAAFLTAVGPLYLVEWSLRPRGGHLEIATLSALAFWAVLRALRAASANEEVRGKKSEAGNQTPPTSDLSPLASGAVRWWLALGAFLLGLGWWVHLTMFYAIAACAVAIVRWGSPLRRDFRALGIALVSFVVGSLPFWLYNLKYPGRTFEWLWGAVRAGDEGPGFFGRLLETTHITIPVLLGSRQTEAAQSFGIALVFLSLIAYVFALCLAMSEARGKKREAGKQPSPQGVRLLLLFSAIVLVAFLIGPFADQARDPRVLLPLYGALPSLAAAGIMRWWTGGRIRYVGAAAIIAALGVLHVSGYRRAERETVQPRVQGQRVPASLEPLKMFLETNQIHRVYCSYYIGYRLAFETGERVIACTDGDPNPERYPPYAEAVRKSDRPAPLIASPRMAEWLEADLKKRGIGFAVASAPDFRVFHNLTAPYRDYPSGPRVCVPVRIEVGDYKKRCQPRETLAVRVAVKNEGSIAWPAPPNWRAVLLTYHLLDPQTGRMIRYENRRFLLPRTMDQGESVTVTMRIGAPDRAGRYAFVPDLVIEGVAWLSAFQPDLLAKPSWREFSVEP